MRHMVTLREMGLMLGEIRAPDELAADGGHDKMYDSCWSLTPLLIAGAVGSAVAPLAIK
jgi:hypothetical protein